MLLFKISAGISPWIVAFEPSRLRISFLTLSEVTGVKLKTWLALKQSLVFLTLQWEGNSPNSSFRFSLAFLVGGFQIWSNIDITVF